MVVGLLRVLCAFCGFSHSLYVFWLIVFWMLAIRSFLSRNDDLQVALCHFRCPELLFRSLGASICSAQGAILAPWAHSEGP